MRIPEAIPPLGGRTKVVIGAVWWVLLSVALVSGTVGLHLDAGNNGRLARACADVGLRCTTSARGVMLDEPYDASLAARGIHAGQRIVSIDGHAPGTLVDTAPAVAALAGIDGDAVVVRLEDDGRRVTQHTLIRQARSTDAAAARPGVPLDRLLLAWSAFGVVVSLVTLGLATLLFLRGHGAPSAVLISFGMILVIADDGMSGFGHQQLYDISRAGNALGGLCLAVAPLLFPDGRLKPRWTWWLLLAAPVLWSWLYLGGVTGIRYLAVMLGFQVLTLSTVVLRYRCAGPGVERQQIKWAAIGFAGSMLCYALFAVANPWLVPRPGPDTWLGGIGGFVISGIGTMLFPAGMTVALIRYRLYDAESAVSRSVAYGAMTLGLLAIFAGTEKVIEVLGEQYLGGSLGALAGGLGAAVAAVMIVPLHHRASAWAERRFQKNLTWLRDGLPLLVGDLRETADQQELAGEVLRRCEEGVRSRCGVVIAADGIVRCRGVDFVKAAAWRAAWTPPAGEDMQCEPGDRLFPMRIRLAADGVGSVGWLLLGPRPDGSFYGKDEREALQAVAGPVARALAIVRRREAQSARWESRLATIEAAIARGSMPTQA